MKMEYQCIYCTVNTLDFLTVLRMIHYTLRKNIDEIIELNVFKRERERENFCASNNRKLSYEQLFDILLHFIFSSLLWYNWRIWNSKPIKIIWYKFWETVQKEIQNQNMNGFVIRYFLRIQWVYPFFFLFLIWRFKLSNYSNINPNFDVKKNWRFLHYFDIYK